MTGPAASSAHERVRSDDIDPVAIQRYIDNDWPLPHLEDHEREPVGRAMYDADIPLREIAARLGIYNRAVTRWRERWGDR